jgi:hypothetical protein
MDSFTFVISSYNSNTAATANNCFIKLAGLPNNQKFLCEVIDFAINTNTIAAPDATLPAGVVPVTQSYYTLTASTEMQILNGVHHPNKFNRICNISRATGLLTGCYGHTFQVGNFNNHTVNFKLELPDLTFMSTLSINQPTAAVQGTPIITYWTLSLKMTPIE